MNLRTVSLRVFAWSPAVCLGILPLRADTFSVTTTADSGPGSLRQAILDSNSTPGPNTIDFDIPGLAPFIIFPTSPLPLVTASVTIDARSQPGFSGTPVVGIDGTMAGPANGLVINSSDCVVQGLAITDFQVDTSLGDPNLTGNGILIDSGGNHKIRGNYLGVDTSGVGASFGNSGDGLQVLDSHDNLIGGPSPLDRNVIANNALAGGGSLLTHPRAGLVIYGDSAVNNHVVGNYIGLNASGGPLGNYYAGLVVGASSNTIGGTESGDGNVIAATQRIGSLFTGYGILLAFHNCYPCEAASANVIEGNLIGTDPTARVALGNAFVGVQIVLGSNNRIGDSVPGAANLISGNGTDGINIGAYYSSISANNVVQANLIGTDSTGLAPLPNGRDGVMVTWDMGSETSNNWIGSSGDPIHGANIIAFNGRNGVSVGEYAASATTGVSILANSIFGNGFLGIDLGADGLTVNHPCDTVPGPNSWQNYPVLNAAYTDGSHIAVSGTLDSRANLPCELEFFWNDGCDQHGNGRNYIDRMSVTPDGSCTVSFSATLLASVPANKFLTATATSSDKSTSEFAACVPILAAPSLSVTIAGTPPVVTLVWSTDFVGWVLQRSPPVLPATWTDDPNPVVVVGAQNTVSESAVGAYIYRLRSP